ncbi:MAG: dihydropteroate synthase [Alphaproteobacteria bacterium]
MAEPPLLRRWSDIPGYGARTLVMGVVNVTRDSFSGDGLIAEGTDHIAAAVDVARAMARDGADILDIGAESTRPGAEPVPDSAERARLVPVIAAVASAVDRPISVDTRHARTAAAALDAGAAIVNDVSGLTHDAAMAPLCADRCVPVVVMHNAAKGTVQKTALGGRYVDAAYGDVVAEVRDTLAALAARAVAAGIEPAAICLDPGIGFGKTVEQNLRLLNRLDALRPLGYPLLLGASRKSFIGYTLDLPLDERLEGTAATVALGIARGAAVVRVHDVKAMARVARMTDAILAAG